MTRAGFISGMGKYYEPRDLQITKVYHFDMVNPNESSFIYVMKDSNGIQGYSVDAARNMKKQKNSIIGLLPRCQKTTALTNFMLRYSICINKNVWLSKHLTTEIYFAVCQR